MLDEGAAIGCDVVGDEASRRPRENRFSPKAKSRGSIVSLATAVFHPDVVARRHQARDAAQASGALDGLSGEIRDPERRSITALEEGDAMPLGEAGRKIPRGVL
jgi:hypothetical protein